MSDSRADNPMLADEEPYRPDHDTGAAPRPQGLEQKMDEVTSQDLTGQGDTGGERPYALPGEDEGPLGEGGQLRYGDAGGGGSS